MEIAGNQNLMDKCLKDGMKKDINKEISNLTSKSILLIHGAISSRSESPAYIIIHKINPMTLSTLSIISTCPNLNKIGAVTKKLRKSTK